jgi:DNA-binding Lrp family transcriptional regulator
MALAGDLSEFPLTDIIQLLDLSKKTGAVCLQGRRGAQQLEGWLYFRDGRIVGATCGSLPPLEAAYTFFTFSAGPFQFYEGAQLPAPTITASNEMIIMEGVMRQDAWSEVQEQLPPLTMIPRLVPNPAASGSEISLEADEWRVLTMVNGKNTVGHIAQRSGLGELRTCEIIARLLGNGLIERRTVSLSESLFPEMERIVMGGLGSSARALLYDSYTRAGVRDQNSATAEQITAALDLFEPAATRAFGAARVRQPVGEMRALVEQAFSVNR